MAKKLEIISLPHPSLREPSRKIKLIDEKIKNLAHKMIDQALLWEKDRPYESTVGLAAVQINQLFKIIIIQENLGAEKESSFKVLINPKVIKYGGQKSINLEGCLSVPNFYTNVERYDKIKISALDLAGNNLRFKAQGFLARILQHELDHLEGIMTVDRAVETVNQAGDKFSFCRLIKDGEFEIIDKKEVEKTGILKDE